MIDSASEVAYSNRAPDPSAYLALFETTGWNAIYGCDADELARGLASSWFTVAAHREGELIGAGRLVSDGVLYATVYDMIVAPAWQGRGIGTSILDRLLARCREAGIRDVLLFAAQGTEPFYRRRGFVPRPDDAPGMILCRAAG